AERFSSVRIQGDQARIESAVQNSAFSSWLTLPVGRATVLEKLARPGAPRFRVELPNLLTRLRVQSNHTIVRRGEGKHCVNHDWRRFKWRNCMPIRFVASAVTFCH